MLHLQVKIQNNTVPLTVLVVVSHRFSLQLLETYIKGQSLFPEYSITFMLDDIMIGYYDSETNLYIVRGNTTEEDDTFNENYHKLISEDMYKFIDYRLKLQFDNHTNSK